MKWRFLTECKSVNRSQLSGNLSAWPAGSALTIRLSVQHPEHFDDVWCVSLEAVSLPPQSARPLACLRRRKENLLQYFVALKRGVAEVLCEARLVEMPNIFAAARGRTSEDHLTKYP
jgi:hypothetical protein